MMWLMCVVAMLGRRVQRILKLWSVASWFDGVVCVSAIRSVGSAGVVIE